MSASGPTWRESLNKRMLIDNGAYMIKASLCHEQKPVYIFNAVGRDRKTRTVHIGNKLYEELESGHSNIQVTHPIVRGLLQDSDIETVIWKQIFSRYKKFDERVSCLCLTLPPIIPDIVQNRIAEVVFEDFQFDAMLNVSSHSMIRESILQEQPTESEQPCQLVIDSGFSFTYGVPFFNGFPLKYAATRLDVGGKLLTNLLNEIISYKEVNLQGETFLVNDIKEKLCYVSTRFNEDLEIQKQKQNPIAKEYVLPDYKTTTKGQIRDPTTIQQIKEDQKQEQQIDTSKKKVQEPIQQVVKMGNERFQVPEILFNPLDIGINEAGMAEMVQQIVNKCPKQFNNLLYQNIMISGGNVLFNGFQKRLTDDLSIIKPNEANLKVQEASNPQEAAWKGLKIFCSNKQNFEEFVVTRKEYHEEGVRSLKRFCL